ncbi:MAG: hypothetical protein IT366_04095 [Candidatus Hydrogenedentes bacterium]|nr:hypothetical protein [Candidatus Hydrogenedentota bacterium]
MRLQTHSFRLVTFAMVYAAWRANALPDLPTLEELLPELPPAQFSPTLGQSISSSIDLSTLRLAWTDSDRSMVELTSTVDAELEFLKVHLQSIYDEAFQSSVECREWILAHVSERIGADRWLYCVNDGSLLSARITGVSYEYDELNGSVRFLGNLEIPQGTINRRVYVSFASDTKPRVSKPEPKEFPKADFVATQNWIKSESDEPGLLMVKSDWLDPDVNYKTVTLLDARHVPQTNLNLVTVRHELSDLLLFLAPVFDQSEQKIPSRWKCIGLDYVADRPGDHCGATSSTTIYALPDFNNDGCRELMVNSSYTTSLYDLSLKDRDTPHVLRCQLGLPTAIVQGRQ